MGVLQARSRASRNPCSTAVGNRRNVNSYYSNAIDGNGTVQDFWLSARDEF